MKKIFFACAIAAGFALPSEARAFCGFYVSGADTKLFNNATQVVLMREGTRTVLSMSNNYQGPTSDFAMVVPVPVILQKENVKTLEKAVFEHVDQLSAPRLVEYWERDPCSPPMPEDEGGRMYYQRGLQLFSDDSTAYRKLGVKVEAKFTVGEYDVVILSAKDASGLDTWLRQEKYSIPAGAERYLRPYVIAGSKFFVAKVDAKKVKFENGMAQLSPLRFHYDSETFSLPIRLGLMNSRGKQDLIVNVLAKGTRYELSNYPNATIPTNLDIAESARTQFGAFYAALFDRTLEQIPKVVVTEYAWDASTCDPCPTPALSPEEINVLGADVLPSASQGDEAMRGRRWGSGGFVLTRLHARYGADSLGEDLVFRAAGAISGGREMRADGKNLEKGAATSDVNNFQGRYVIRHPWTGAIACANPQRGIWGGPPGGGAPNSTPATNLAFAPRGNLNLATMIPGGAPEVVALPGAVTPLGTQVVVLPGGSAPPPLPPPEKSGCGCNMVGAESASGAAAIAAVLAVFRRRRRRTDQCSKQ